MVDLRSVFLCGFHFWRVSAFCIWALSTDGGATQAVINASGRAPFSWLTELLRILKEGKFEVLRCAHAGEELVRREAARRAAEVWGVG